MSEGNYTSPTILRDEKRRVVFAPLSGADLNAAAHAAASQKALSFPVKVEMDRMPAILKEELRDILTKSAESFIQVTLQSNPDVERKRREWNTEGEIPRESDGIYDGTWLEHRKHGWGTYVWKDGRKYIGEWKENKIEGKGVYIWGSGEKGKKDSTSFGNDPQRSGFGKRGERGRYEGEWKDNRMNGWGVYHWADGRQYEGQWKNDMMDGHGTFVWPDKSVYQGEFSNDEMHGNGVKMWSDGSFYMGEWRNDKKHGKGKYIWPDGKSSYEGEWFEDAAHGSGVMAWYYPEKGVPKKALYEGEWERDQKHGKGVYTWPDGTKFNGVWNRNKRGDGVYSYPDGTTFK